MARLATAAPSVPAGMVVPAAAEEPAERQEQVVPAVLVKAAAPTVTGASAAAEEPAGQEVRVEHHDQIVHLNAQATSQL